MALLGAIGNTLFHGWLTIQSGGYVPGVVTSLANLPLGIALVVLLTRSGRNTIDESMSDLSK
jgi:hypothetical protein